MLMISQFSSVQLLLINVLCGPYQKQQNVKTLTAKDNKQDTH